MNQTRNIDFPQENKQFSEIELFRPFQRSPESKPLEMCQQEKSELLDISASIRNDISYLQTEKKKTQPKPSFKLIGLLKVDKLIQNFKQTLAKKAYVYNKQSRKVIEKFALEKYFSKKITKFNVYNEEKYFQIPTFDQSNLVIFFWEFIKIFSLIIILWAIPIIWSFENKQQDEAFFVFCYSLAYILFDILIKLNTQIISQGNIIKERKQILNFYLKDEFLEDGFLFFSILIILITFHNQDDSENAIISTTSLFICSIVSYIKLNDQINKMLLYTNMNHLYREYLNLISLLFSISSFAHILACVWHFVGDKSGNYFHKSWLIQKGLQHESVQTKYCFSYYWATVTMITVGYGDITPQNTIETLTCILLMFMACVVFAYSINKIGSILQSINDQKAQFIENIRIVSHYLRQHSIPTHLQNRIRSYLQYLQDESLNQNTQIVTQMDKLPNRLKSELKYNVFKFLIKNCEFLLAYFSEKTLQNLSLKIKPFQYCPDEIIYLQGSIEDSSLYFIDYGEIKLIENQSQTELCTLKSGQQFGEWEFFTQQARKCTAISIGFTKVYKIQREEFLNSLDFDDTEQFHQIKDKILQHLPIDGIKCTACGSKIHTILDCSYLFYKPDLERIILTYNYQKNIVRKPWKRQLGRFETFKMLPIIQLRQKEFEQKQEANEKNSSIGSFDQEQQHNSQEQLHNIDSLSQIISIKQIPQEIHNCSPSQIKIQNQKLNESKSAKGIYLIEPKNNSNIQTDLLESSTKQQGDKRHNTFIIKDAQNRTQTNTDCVVLQTDRLCEFHHYFTHLNCSRIILQYNSFTKTQKKLSRRQRGNVSKYTLMQSFTKYKLL